MNPLAVRWTIGDVSDRGWEQLRLSVWGARRLFGPAATYAVCVNTVSVAAAVDKAGPMPAGVEWHPVVAGDIPTLLTEHLDRNMAEGVGWKLAPLRLYPDRHELSLDNDCVLWDVPGPLAAWLDAADATLFAADVSVCLGQFETEAGAVPRNSGIRGLPPGFDFAAALREGLARAGRRLGRRVVLTSELDEQGLQAAAVSLDRPPLVVTTADVSICSPFHPHQPELGRCGAHFVGSNARHIGWNYYDRPADVVDGRTLAAAPGCGVRADGRTPAVGGNKAADVIGGRTPLFKPRR